MKLQVRGLCSLWQIFQLNKKKNDYRSASKLPGSGERNRRFTSSCSRVLWRSKKCLSLFNSMTPTHAWYHRWVVSLIAHLSFHLHSLWITHIHAGISSKLSKLIEKSFVLDLWHLEFRLRNHILCVYRYTGVFLSRSIKLIVSINIQNNDHIINHKPRWVA